jgi:hypothetical protein
LDTTRDEMDSIKDLLHREHHDCEAKRQELKKPNILTFTISFSVSLLNGDQCSV